MTEQQRITPLGMARELASLIIPVMLQSMRRKVESGEIVFMVRETSRDELSKQIQSYLAKPKWSLEDVRMLASLFCTLAYLGTYHSGG